MKYLKDIWIHKNPKFPTTSYYEIDEEYYMRRVISIFENGKVETYAEVREGRLPIIEEMGSDSNETDCIAYVSQEEFEDLWNKYAPK